MFGPLIRASRFNQETGQFETDGAGAVGSNPLPPVSDPDKHLLIPKQEYMDYLENFRTLKKIRQNSTTDTSLIDYAREDAAGAAERTRAVAERNRSRYGIALNPAEVAERERSINRGSVLGGVQSIADARIAQRDQNQKLLNDLMAIGQGINRNSLAQLGSAAADATSRNNAYRSQAASSKQRTVRQVVRLNGYHGFDVID